MENRVGDNVPSQADMAVLLAQSQALNAAFEKFCVLLTSEERQSRLKPLRGAEIHIRKVNDLCQRYGVGLKSVPLDGMMADLNLFLAIDPLVAILKVTAQLVEDTQDQAFSEAWQAFLALYGALSKAAEHDPALAAELAGVVTFMSTYGKKKPGKAHGTAPAAPPAPTAPAAGTTKTP